MLWGWLVMLQGLTNAPATFNRCVTHLLRSVHDFAPTYFDDVFIHSRAVNGKSDVEMHKEHLRKLFALMRKHKRYANLKKCIIGASEIHVLACLVGKNGVRPDPEKVRVINEWPTPSNVKELRQFLGLATYLCKYVRLRQRANLARVVAAVAAPKEGRCVAVHKADANTIDVVRTSTPSSSLLDDVRSAYANDADAKQLLNYFAAPSDKSRQKLAKHLRAGVHRYRVHNGLLLYSAVDDSADRVVVPDDPELKLRITYEYHDAPTSGHPGREKTYLLLTRDFYWSHQYKWVRKYVRACEVCQRVKSAPFSQAPLQSLPTPSDCWQSISMDFGFGLPPDNKQRTGIVVFVDRFSKMVHLVAVPAEVTAKQTARLFVDMVFRYHGIPIDIASDRDPRFTARFWLEVFTLLAVSRRARNARSTINESTVSTPGVDTLNINNQHTQAGPVVNKDAELNTEFSSKAVPDDQRSPSIGASCSNRSPNEMNQDECVAGQHGVYTYRIQGAMGHYLGPLLPHVDPLTNLPKPAKFAQIYIVDPDMQRRAEGRRGIFADLDPGTLLDIEQMITEVNPFAQQFLNFAERLRQDQAEGKDVVDMVYRLHEKRSNPRTYNLPTVSEVGATLIEDGKLECPRDILLWANDYNLLRLFETNPMYDPLQYPLLLPHGELGWTHTDTYANNIERRNKREMSLREHVAYRLYQKVDDHSVLTKVGDCFSNTVWISMLSANKNNFDGLRRIKQSYGRISTAVFKTLSLVKRLSSWVKARRY
ncbi:unnamed protein product [Phytophthora fragariaefolia]|uniref:Unnamed protein product n=1 Tax=Phytophthora fragariaefolia TaxID=1490495 RepID=A0A9W7D3I6_9STRA|nr:unnamed protein product [Phytophthora fragariaefolia]